MFFNQISKLTLGIGIFIIISASFTRQLLNFAKAHIGIKCFLALVGITFAILSLSLLTFSIRKKSHFINILALVIILIIGITLNWQLKIPEEKTHVLEYSILGWFAGRDLIKTNRKVKGAFLACVICIAVGISEELFQKILPYRYFDLRDILFNCLGGAWGIILYLLT